MAKFQLFFSHRSGDKKRVEELQGALRQLLPNLPFEDVSVNVPFVDDWKAPALPILESCHALICVVGMETHQSEPVDWEIREAHRLGKPLTVTRVSRDCQIPPCCIELHIPVYEWNTADLAGRIGELLVSRALFIHHNWDVGVPAAEAIWNQYNLMVQSWEALISRRQTVNTLYVSADAALLAGIGALASSTDATGTLGAAMGAAILALLGLAMSFNWRRTVVSYGTLSRAKARVIASMEAFMPAQLFDAEWKVLEAKRYRSTTETDTQTALFFMLLFLALIVVSAGVAIAQFLQGDPGATLAV